jgi:hypothetical protein
LKTIQKINIVILEIIILDFINNILLVLMLFYLKYTDIKRLEKINIIRRKLERDNIILLAKDQEIFREIGPITIKYKYLVDTFRFMSSMIIEMPKLFLQESFVTIARF